MPTHLPAMGHLSDFSSTNSHIHLDSTEETQVCVCVEGGWRELFNVVTAN